MTLRNAFEDVATEATLDDVLRVLVWILDKLPRTDQLDRAIVSLNDTGGSTVSISGTSNVTISGTPNVTMTGIGSSNRPPDAIPIHIAQAGATYIYDNIIVS